jgi:putative endonuclease
MIAGGDLGRRGERVAASYLRKRGIRILAQNVRGGGGEIDLVATDGATLIFVEVKSRTRRADDEVTGLERIDSRKRQALRRASSLYRKKAPADLESYRLDAITVEFEKASPWARVREVRWYQGILDLDA